MHSPLRMHACMECTHCTQESMQWSKLFQVCRNKASCSALNSNVIPRSAGPQSPNSETSPPIVLHPNGKYSYLQSRWDVPKRPPGGPSPKAGGEQQNTARESHINIQQHRDLIARWKIWRWGIGATRHCKKKRCVILKNSRVTLLGFFIFPPHCLIL